MTTTQYKKNHEDMGQEVQIKHHNGEKIIIVLSFEVVQSVSLL